MTAQDNTGDVPFDGDDIEAAVDATEEIGRKIIELRDNPVIDGHAADDYLGEAHKSVRAAVFDIEAAYDQIAESSGEGGDDE